MSTLTEIINSGETWAADRATYASQVVEAVQSGELSADEGKEILADIIRTEALEEASTNAQMRAALVFAISTAASTMM
jgi:polyhydroxyalkanoate synthesis regulator phasin